MRIVMTNGCFDILHAGHVDFLRQAKAFGDFLVVAVNDDDSVRRLKGFSRPVNCIEDRIAVLRGLRWVDMVVPFGDDTPVKLIDAIRPDVLVKGADYTVEQIAGADIVQSYGGTVELVPLMQGRSTTAVIDRAQISSLNEIEQIEPGARGYLNGRSA